MTGRLEAVPDTAMVQDTTPIPETALAPDSTPNAGTHPDAGTRPDTPAEVGTTGGEAGTGNGTDAARQRLALAQTALLSALVAGTPVPEGFDRTRLRVQSRALAAKRAEVVAKVAPELPEILGADYRAAFAEHARNRPMSGGYRQDALDFAAYLLAQRRPEDPAARRQLSRWWRDRAGPKPPSARPAAQLARALRLFRGPR